MSLYFGLPRKAEVGEVIHVTYTPDTQFFVVDVNDRYVKAICLQDQQPYEISHPYYRVVEMDKYLAWKAGAPNGR